MYQTQECKQDAMSDVEIYYLEMTQKPEVAYDSPSQPILRIEECCLPQPRFNKFLYLLVGEAWEWDDKKSWTDEQWRLMVADPGHRTWIAYCQGAIAGYYELHKNKRDVEILYFGLAKEFIGRGFGKVLLEHAIGSAWSWEPVSRVWLHTCSKDHPGAKNNYLARGFRQYKVEKDCSALL